MSDGLNHLTRAIRSDDGIAFGRQLAGYAEKTRKRMLGSLHRGTTHRFELTDRDFGLDRQSRSIRFLFARGQREHRDDKKDRRGGFHEVWGSLTACLRSVIERQTFHLSLIQHWFSPPRLNEFREQRRLFDEYDRSCTHDGASIHHCCGEVKPQRASGVSGWHVECRATTDRVQDARIDRGGDSGILPP